MGGWAPLTFGDEQPRASTNDETSDVRWRDRCFSLRPNIFQAGKGNTGFRVCGGGS